MFDMLLWIWRDYFCDYAGDYDRVHVLMQLKKTVSSSRRI